MAIDDNLKYITLADMNTYFAVHVDSDIYKDMTKTDKVAYAQEIERIMQSFDWQVNQAFINNNMSDVDCTEISLCSDLLDFYFDNSTDFQTLFKQSIYEATIYYFQFKDTIQQRDMQNNFGIDNYSTSKINQTFAVTDKIKMYIGQRSFEYVKCFLPANTKLNKVSFV